MIFHEGDEGAEMYVITQGRVEIRKATGPSSAKTLTTLQTGDLFGEMAIIDQQAALGDRGGRRADQAARAERQALRPDARAPTPTSPGAMIRILSERIRHANAIIQSLMATNRQNQVWAGLVEYAKEHGVSTFKGSRVKIADFVEWAVEHLGMSEKDVEAILEVFLHRDIISYSARGKEEILVEPKTGARAARELTPRRAAHGPHCLQQVRQLAVEPRHGLAVGGAPGRRPARRPGSRGWRGSPGAR